MTAPAVERSEVRFGTKAIGYSIRRSSRRATVSIAIDKNEGVLVTAPEAAPIRRLNDIVHAKASWIVGQLKKQADRPPPPSAKEFVSGETFLYLGRQYRLRIDLDKEPRPVRLDNGWLRLPFPRHLGEQHRGSFVRAALIDWYRRHARRRLPMTTRIWAQKLGLPLREVMVTEPRKRWGSASARGGVRLNWRVIQAPPSIVDYVVVHELTHLRHPNHTREFWAALGRVMPEYESKKARLRQLGPQLDW